MADEEDFSAVETVAAAPMRNAVIVSNTLSSNEARIELEHERHPIRGGGHENSRNRRILTRAALLRSLLRIVHQNSRGILRETRAAQRAAERITRTRLLPPIGNSLILVQPHDIERLHRLLIGGLHGNSRGIRRSTRTALIRGLLKVVHNISRNLFYASRITGSTEPPYFEMTVIIVRTQRLAANLESQNVVNRSST